MISNITLAAEIRDGRGSNEARRLRRTGRVPVCVYSGGKDALIVSVAGKELAALLRNEDTRHAIFNLDIVGKGPASVMVKDLQIDPIRGTLVHADLMQVDLTVKAISKVNLHLVGDAAGVKMGGILEHGVREIEVECLPKDLPGHIDIDVTHLKLNSHLYASDVKLPEGVRLVSDGHQMVAAVLTPRGAAVEEASQTTAVEPEVIKRGKAEE